MAGPVLYVLKRYPRISETFIVHEILRLEAAGVRVLIDSLLPPEDGPTHAAVGEVRAPARVVPGHPRLHHVEVARAHAPLVLRHPVRWVRLARRARREGTWRRFLQAGLVAERALAAGVTNLHAHFATAAAEVARDAGALTGIPVTVTAHAKDVFHVDNAPLLPQRLRGVAAVVTVSDHNAQHLRSILQGTEVRHIPNGVPVEEPLGGVEGGPILCVARLVDKKGVDVLIDAARLLIDRRPHPPRVEVIGGGELSGSLRAQARSLDLDDVVTFRGVLTSDQVEDAYARCSMVVLPCRVSRTGDRDGMPTVLVEAAARALPIVTTDVVGIPELVEHGETGLLVPPDDAVSLADAIERLLDDRVLASQLAGAARKRVAERYDPAQSTVALTRLFEEVVA